MPAPAAAPATATEAAPAAPATTAPSLPCLDGDVAGCSTRCDGGDLESCVRLAETYRFGNANARPDKAKAVALLRRACDGKVGKACYWLASTGEPSQKAALVARASPLITGDCDRGDAASCEVAADLAMLAKDGARETALRARAEELYGKACNAGDATACGSYAAHFYATKDYAGAVPMLAKGCDAGDAESCKWLASQYAEGLGVKGDAKRAQALYRRACERGSEAACDKAK